MTFPFFAIKGRAGQESKRSPQGMRQERFAAGARLGKRQTLPVQDASTIVPGDDDVRLAADCDHLGLGNGQAPRETKAKVLIFCLALQMRHRWLN